jgi:hypothetical protein
MLSVYDFSTGDHAVMLSDQTRLDAFHQAITNQVKEGMVVAEIGTGTGILSAFAASKTKAPIFAIEFYEKSAELAERMFKAAHFDQVKVMRGKSYDLTLDPQPEILITETIGALGPEENIVEICYDFKKRHPKLASIIPSKIRVCAEPIRSNNLVGWEQNFYDCFNCASFGPFDYKTLQPELEKSWTHQVRYDSITDAEKVGDSIVLVEYVLGETELATFTKEIDLTNLKEADALHIYFEAVLDQDVLISTHYSLPETHWRHAYVARPPQGNKVSISYSTGDVVFRPSWKV